MKGRTVSRALALVVVPAAIGLSHAWLSWAITPLWMGGSTDPTYLYVLNGLLVAEGSPPAVATHPGVPLSFLGGCVLHAAHGVSGSTLPLREHVLRDPELFAGAFRGVLLALIVGADVLLGRAAYRVTRSLAVTAAVQIAPLASHVAARTMLQVMCEPLLLVFGLLLSAGLLQALDPARESRRAPLVLGLIAGLGVATKLSFGAVALLPLAVLRGSRRRAAYAAATAATFGVAMAPLWPQLAAIRAWFWGWVVHTGRETGGFGEGRGGFLDPEMAGAIMGRLLREEGVVYALAALAVVAALASRGDASTASPWKRCLLAAVSVQGLVLFLSAKSMSPHHLMPAVSLAGLVVCLGLLCTFRGGDATRLTWAVALGLVVFLAGRHAYFVRGFLERRSAVLPGARSAAAAADAIGRDRVIQGYQVSSHESCLASANEWTARAFGADLRRLHPHVLFFDWAGLHRFGAPVALAELQERLLDGDSLAIWDTAWFPHEMFGYFRGLPARAIGAWGRDRLLRVSLEPLAENAAGGHAFAGVLLLNNSVDFDRPSPARRHDGFVPLGPKTRLAVLGQGQPIRLLVEARLEEAGTQVLSFSVGGRVLAREPLSAAEGWRAMAVGLPSARGLFEVAVDHDRLFTSEDAARPVFPGYGGPRPETRWAGVRYRKLQAWTARGEPSASRPAARTSPLAEEPR